MQLVYLSLTSESIASVTYMDHFDFEDRYRDVTKCDAMYWHPLPLPSHCMDMFMKLIRSTISNDFPVRIGTNREDGLIYLNDYKDVQPMYLIDTHILEDYVKSQSPYQQVLHYLQKDIKKRPVKPKMEVLPYLGLSAIYKQPISRKSEGFIKAMADMYSKLTKHNEEYYLGKIETKKVTENKKNVHSENTSSSNPDEEKQFLLKTIN